MISRLSFFAMLILLQPWAKAANLIFLDSNLYYASDSFTTATANTNTKTLYDICVGFSVSKNNQFQVGWNYSGHSFAESTAGTVTTYATTQMGPRFLFYFDKRRQWRMSLAYNLSTTATYTAGSNPAEKWKGTGMSADMGYQLNITDGFAFGVRLSYTTTSYKESLVNETTYSQISYIKTYMYPSVALTYEF